MVESRGPESPFLSPINGPKIPNVSNNGPRNAPKLIKTIYECVSTNNLNILIPFA